MSVARAVGGALPRNRSTMLMMATHPRNEKPFERPRFKVDDRVSLRLGLQNSLGTIIEDRGFLGSGGRRLYRVKVEFDPPSVTFIELPEEDLRAVP